LFGREEIGARERRAREEGKKWFISSVWHCREIKKRD